MRLEIGSRKSTVSLNWEKMMTLLVPCERSFLSRS